MKPLLRKPSSLSFAKDEAGIVMTEALVAVPFLFLLAVGVLEFGAVMWEREQIQTGLRDAARYMARCRLESGCDTNARNLALYGTVNGTGQPRVPGWNTANSQFSVINHECDLDEVEEEGESFCSTATTTHQMVTSPLFGALNIDGISVTLAHTQRKIGW